MRFKALTITLFVFLTVVCLAIAQTENSPSEKWEAPAEAAAKSNPEAKNPDAPAMGRKLFMRTCAGCHEEDGSGKDTGAANLRSPEVQAQSDGALFWKITHGNTEHGMPSFATLPETNRWDVITFVRTLKDDSGKGSEGSEGKKPGSGSSNQSRQQQ